VPTQFGIHPDSGSRSRPLAPTGGAPSSAPSTLPRAASSTQVVPQAISATFTGFLEQLLAAYPAVPVVAVACDNVIIGHSKLSRIALARP
jgi:hypothetical protein